MILRIFHRLRKRARWRVKFATGIRDKKQRWRVPGSADAEIGAIVSSAAGRQPLAFAGAKARLILRRLRPGLSRALVTKPALIELALCRG